MGKKVQSGLTPHWLVLGNFFSSFFLCFFFFFLSLFWRNRNSRCGDDALRAQRPPIGRARDRSSCRELFAGDHAHQGVWVFAWGGRLLPLSSIPPSVHPSAWYKARVKTKVVYIFAFGLLSCSSTHHIMTIKTEAEKPVLTYSKSRGLVALVTGMESLAGCLTVTLPASDGLLFLLFLLSSWI